MRIWSIAITVLLFVSQRSFGDKISTAPTNLVSTQTFGANAILLSFELTEKPPSSDLDEAYIRCEISGLSQENMTSFVLVLVSGDPDTVEWGDPATIAALKENEHAILCDIAPNEITDDIAVARFDITIDVVGWLDSVRDESTWILMPLEAGAAPFELGQLVTSEMVVRHGPK